VKRAFVLAAAALIAACGSPAAPGVKPAPAGSPRTRAEATNYLETSHYTDVIAFLDTLEKQGVPMYRTTIGTSTQGRAIPMVVLSRPVVKSPAEAKALGRPIVYVQANIHAGEVEGKEALLALIRDIERDGNKNVLDSIVLLAVPIYNTDGNEKWAPQSVNRTEQNGPETVGQRPNGQGLDLNRDYVKGEAPETRASLAVLNAWDPDVFVDLHTTDGSFHGYAVTYAPSLNPAATFGGPYARDSMLPAIKKNLNAMNVATFDYGNFSLDYGTDVNADTIKQGWYTYDSRPRFGTNYVGLRGRVAILVEGYSHDPFDRRVATMYAFVQQILSYAAAHGKTLTALSKRADSAVVAWGASPGTAPALALRSSLSRSPLEEVVVAEDLVKTGDSSLTQPGVPKGLKRTGHFRSQMMPVYIAFEATLTKKMPYAYAIPVGDSAMTRVLKMHGVRLEPLTAAWSGTVQRYVIDSVHHAERPFQGHHETTVFGKWRDTVTTLPAGSMIVKSAQPLGVVAFYLLEPESDDGLVTWNFFDAAIAPGFTFPVWRIPGAAGGLNDAR
jgi:murein tripeptide amidase MpaA